MRTLVTRRALLAAALVACGSRTGVDVGFGSSGADARPSSEPDATVSRDSAPRPDSSRPVDAGADVVDRCPAAILVHAGLPMLGNCSTRDGRARVAGPKAPHVTWATMAPTLPIAGDLPQVALSDASGFVYFLSSYGDMFLRIDGSTGDVTWSSSFLGGPSDSFLLPNGTGATLGPRQTPLQVVLDVFAPASGAVTSMNFGSTIEAGIGMPGFYDLGAAPVIGDDGSFYVAYSKNNGPQYWYPALSRVLPDGTFAWTSATLYPEGVAAPLPSVAPLAIGKDGVLIVGAWPAEAPKSTITGVDPSTGHVLWNTAISGGLVGGPAIAPDGSIAVVATTPGDDPYDDLPVDATLFVLEPTGQGRHKVTFGHVDDPPAFPALYAVARDGTVLVGTNDLIAISSSGEVLWTVPPREVDAGFGQPPPEVVSAFLDANDTVIVTYANGPSESSGSIVGLDLATGATLWTLHPPEPPTSNGRVVTLAPTSTVLTSAGGIVGVAMGTVSGPHVVGTESTYALFGASD